MKQIIRHGDICLTKISKLPKGLKETKTTIFKE